MSYPRIGDETTLHAEHTRREYELERKLAEKDDAAPAPNCCDSWCAYLTSPPDLAIGATSTVLSVTIPRPRAGRIKAEGYASAMLIDGDGDFFWTVRLSYGGTLYEPRARNRNLAGLQFDESTGSTGSLFDFHAGAAMVVGLYVHNLSGQKIRIRAASLTVEMRGRGGSVACIPPLSGTGG